MIIDITGTELIPGNQGNDCPGNGLIHGVECCCDECDYVMCCLENHDPSVCLTCNDKDCPRSVQSKNAASSSANKCPNRI